MPVPSEKKSKGAEGRLSYLGHVLMENRNGLLVRTMVTQADGTAGRDAALLMAWKIPGTQPITLGGDKNYDTRDFVDTLREMKITPHVAPNEKRPGGSAIDARTTRHPGYQISSRRESGWSNRLGG